MDAHARVNDVRARLYLFAVGTSVRLSDVLDDSLVAAIAVEDACWTIAQQDWVARRPRRWQRRKLAAWQAERDDLYDQREQIRSIAQACGLRTV